MNAARLTRVDVYMRSKSRLLAPQDAYKKNWTSVIGALESILRDAREAAEMAA